MSSQSFGLDIGTSSIKAVWLGTEKDGLVFRSCAATPTPAKGMVSEAPLDQEEVANAVRKLVEEAKIVPKFADIALADHQVYTKVIDMPVLSEKELASAIYWEAEQYIPAQLSTMSLSHQILRERVRIGDSDRMQVLLVAAPKLLIQRYQTVLEMAGLGITTIETEMLSVIRAVVTDESFPPSLIINIGALGTSLAVVIDGTIAFTYSIPIGGVAINRAIALDFGFSDTQAEEYKKVYGITDKTLGGKIGKAIEPILQSMITEIRKALTFYAEKYKSQVQIQQIVLSGGTAKLPGIDMYFVNNVGIATVIANPWQIFNVKYTPSEVFETGSEYIIAFGLAMKSYE
jgi:type IV pilus assembly protein PilM